MSVTLQVTIDEDDDERFIFIFKEHFRIVRNLAGTSRPAKTAEKFENLSETRRRKLSRGSRNGWTSTRKISPSWQRLRLTGVSGFLTSYWFQLTTPPGKWVWYGVSWVKSIEDTKAQFKAVVEWIDKYFIQPIYNLFAWLSEKVQAMWQLILPKLDALNLVNQQANQPVGTGGEAERRAIEGRIIQQRGHGYAPYTQRGTKQLRSAGDVSAQQAPAAEAAAISNASLAQQRAQLYAEYKADPALQEKFARVAQAEMGGTEEGVQALMETTVNRAVARGQTLARTLSADYYEVLRRSLPSISAAQLAKNKAAAESVFAGSNVAKLTTGNFAFRGGGYGGPKGYGTRMVGTEQLSVQSADVGWAARTRAQLAEEKAAKATEAATRAAPAPKETVQKAIAQKQEWTTNPWFRSKTEKPFWGEEAKPKDLKFPKVSMQDALMHEPGGEGSKLRRMIRDMNIQQRVGGATGGQSVAMNGTTINVNGVQPGRESLMAKKTVLALRDPLAQGLAELKRMRMQEQRLGYV